jgi:hypothetical protein
MQRVLGVLIAVVAFGVATTVASASVAHPACSHCGYVWAQGTGTITESSDAGSSYASVKSGSIAVRGGTHKVTGWSSRHWDSKLKATVYKGTKMCLQYSGSFWLQITGTTSNFGSTARASVTLKGTGVYTVNNGPKLKWAQSSHHSLAIRW